MMNSIALDIWCPKCWNRHQHVVDWRLVTQGHNTINDTCPHCGAKLLVTYEVRGIVTVVKPAAGDYPPRRPLEPAI